MANEPTRTPLSSRAIDWVWLFVFVFGLWPLEDPGHRGDTALSLLDIALHAAALSVLLSRWRWRLERRTPPTQPPAATEL